MNKKVVFVWVPRQVGIRDNEKAVEFAKQELYFNVFDLKVPYTDLKVNAIVVLNKIRKPKGMHVLITDYCK